MRCAADVVLREASLARLLIVPPTPSHAPFQGGGKKTRVSTIVLYAYLRKSLSLGPIALSTSMCGCFS